MARSLSLFSAPFAIALFVSIPVARAEFLVLSSRPTQVSADGKAIVLDASGNEPLRVWRPGFRPYPLPVPTGGRGLELRYRYQRGW